MKEILFVKVENLDKDGLDQLFQIAEVFNTNGGNVRVVDMNGDSAIVESKHTEHRNNELVALLKKQYKKISVVRGGAVAIESISTGCR